MEDAYTLLAWRGHQQLRIRVPGTCKHRVVDGLPLTLLIEDPEGIIVTAIGELDNVYDPALTFVTARDGGKGNWKKLL